MQSRWRASEDFRHLRGRRSFLAAAAFLLPVSVAASFAGPLQSAGASGGGTVTYTATLNIPAPPASNFSGATTGDGWNAAFTPTAVYNVFHHQTSLQVDCHLQSNAAQTAPCWGGAVTITPTNGSTFYTSAHPTAFINQSTGNLYVFVTDVFAGTPANDTAGVACISTTASLPASNLFCGYQPLTPAGQGPPTSSNISGASDAVQVGSNMYSFNYVNGTATGAEDELMCFSLTTWSACPNQPFAVTTGFTAYNDNPEPEPAIAAFNNQIVEIPVADGGNTTLACYEPSVAGGSCGGSWPIASGIAYEGANGAAFPLMNSSAQTLGFCLPTGTDPCWTLAGASAPTPTGMTSTTIPSSTGWNGPSVSVGPRVYLPNQDASHTVFCFDYSTNAECTNFPKNFSGINNGPYTVNPDPQRPTCIWINSDSGTSQIQNFDAFTGGTCGSGPIVLQASGFVAPPQQCTPTEWTNLQITSPSPPTVYGGGSVEFENNDGGELTGTGGTNPVNLDSTGSVNLTSYNFSGAENLPDFAITLNNPAGVTSVTVAVSWQATNSSSCTQPGTSVSGSVNLTGPAASAPINTNQTISATVLSNSAPLSGAAVTFTCISGPCTTASGGGTTNASGVATLTYSSSLEGSDIWQATYTPSGEQTETSNDVAVTWNFVATAAPSATTFGNAVTLSETGLPPTATGTVTFTSGGTTLCTLTLTGKAGEATSCTTASNLALGSYPVLASYSGDAANPPSSATTSFSIGQQPTTTTATVKDAGTGGAWSNTELPGASAFDLASVSNGASGNATITLYSGDNCLGTVLKTTTGPLQPNGTLASANSGSLGAGAYSYQAVFAGNADYGGSTGACQPFTVQKAGTLEGVVVLNAAGGTWGNAPETTGAEAQASATLPDPQDSNPSVPTPTGTVTYTFFGNATCSGTPTSTSPVTIESLTVPGSGLTAALAAGTYSFQAAYAGDSNYTGSTSACEPFTVSKATPAVGVTPADSSTGDAWAGTEVTGASAFATSTVTGVDGFTPTSLVTYDFYETAVCTGDPLLEDDESLSDGTPGDSVETDALGAGTYYVQANYAGDSNYNSASSACTSFTVNRAPVAISDQVVDVVPGGNEQTGSSAYDTATLTGVPGFTDTGTVTYRFYPNATCSGEVEGEVVTLSGGNVPNSPDTPALAPGSYSFVASYSGDSNYLPTTGSCLTFSVGVAAPTVGQQVDDAATSTGWSGHELLGAAAFDTATVTGAPGFTPTGTVTYTFYDNGTCSGDGATTDLVDLVDGGVPDSSPTAPLLVGTYSYQYFYSGDTNYGAASSACSAFSVLPAPTVTVGVVDDAATGSLWTGNENQGAAAFDTASVTGEAAYAPRGTVTYQFFRGNTCSGTPQSTDVVTLSSNGFVPSSTSTGALPSGPESYLATYSGSRQYLGSSSACQQFAANAIGYRLEGGDGGLFAFHATYRGSVGFPSPPGLGLHIFNFVGQAATPGGYWMVQSNGGIFNFGSAGFFGSLPSRGISVDDIVGIAATGDGRGYWEVASDGTIYAFGDAVSHGDLPAMGVHVSDIVAIDSPDSGGYWLVGSNGGVYTFGDAHFHGSCGTSGSPCSGANDVVGIANPDAGGYWLVGADGGVFTFGDARYHGACPATGSGCKGVTDVVGIAGPAGDNGGYWLAGANGAVFSFGDALGFGNEVGTDLVRPIVAITG